MFSFTARILVVLLPLTLSAHAQSLANIPSAYVPEANYKRLSCEQLLQERARAENDLTNLYAELQGYHSRYLIDFLALGLPLATLGGNTVAAETYFEHKISHVKGELETMSSVLNRRCGS
jgi:hypothetical protein